MSGYSKDVRPKLLNIAEFLTEDISEMNNADIVKVLEEEGMTEDEAINMARSAFESATRQLGARRFAAARLAVAENKAVSTASVTSIDPKRAKQIVSSYLTRHPEAAPMPNTLAARKGADMPDETALEILQALIELGAISENGEIP